MVKVKPKGNGKYIWYMVCIVKEEFELNYTKNYRKIIKNKFYNSFLLESYRAQMKSSLSEQIKSNSSSNRSGYTGGNFSNYKALPSP
jgi:hypothetical protein